MQNDLTLQDFKLKIEQTKQEVDNFIASFFGKKNGEDVKSHILFEAMKYSVEARGKRLRSFMVLQSCEFFNVAKQTALVICLCVEMIHAYSLIHDDLPCMDNGPTRDGLPTNHIKYGEANALLAGNSLLTLVFEVLSSSFFCVDDQTKLAIINALCHSFGYNGVMAGQVIDITIAKSATEINLEQIFQMQALKTGEFFAFCCSIGAVINGSLNEINHQKQFGHLFGKLYQIVDDILDEGQDEKNSVLAFITRPQALDLVNKIALQVKQISQKPTQYNNLIDLVLSYVGGKI